MTPASFRVRLAIALGLPFVPACKQAAPADVMATTNTPATVASSAASSSTITTPATTSTTTRASKCALDEVHEHVCGLIDPNATTPSAGAAAPFAACPAQPTKLQEFDDFLFIDSSKVGREDPSLQTYRYDSDRTKAYRYAGTADPGDVRCCYDRCTALPISKAARGAPPAGMFVQEKCVPAPEAGTRSPAKGAPTCPAALRLAIDIRGQAGPIDDAPFAHTKPEAAETCCYSVATPQRCPPDQWERNGVCVTPSPGGRPLREYGQIVVAPSRPRADWMDDDVSVAQTRHTLGDFDRATRAYAADAWAREAAAEHASVAAFARLSIDLMILGAPPGVIDDAHVAARDEIRHARLAYGLASAFKGAALGPGPLEMSAAARATTLVSLASECFLDGCIGETVAALGAAEARLRATPAAVCEALDVIVADESRHAELAYRIVAWALSEGGDAVRAQLHADLTTVRQEIARGTSYDGAEERAGFDERAGVLSWAASRDVRRRVLVEIVVPCTEALLTQPEHAANESITNRDKRSGLVSA